jgi:hypothetical protein
VIFLFFQRSRLPLRINKRPAQLITELYSPVEGKGVKLLRYEAYHSPSSNTELRQ